MGQGIQVETLQVSPKNARAKTRPQINNQPNLYKNKKD